MCSSTQTNLLHCLWYTLRQGTILVRDALTGLSSGRQARQLFTLVDPFVSCEFLLERFVSGAFLLLLSVVVEDREFTSSATSMPDSATMSKNGMVTAINTRVRVDLFTANYELVGRELGRWVCVFVGNLLVIDGNLINWFLCVCAGGLEFRINILLIW